MKLYTIENVEYDECLGIVNGSIVKGRFFIQDYIASIRKLIGKELVEYSDLISDSRRIALERMSKEAESLGADAVIGIRFTTTDISSEAAEICAYGTAVKLRKMEKRK